MPEPENSPVQDESSPSSVPPDATSPTADAPALPVTEAPTQAGDLDEYEPLTPELVEEEAIRGDFVLRWAVVLLAFLLGSTRIADSAALVHIKTGQYLASHGILPPATDVFSYTASDRPWTNLSWVFDLFSAAVYSLGDFAGLSVMKALCIALAFWMLGRISRPGTSTWWGSICGALALLGCHLQLIAQPSLLTFFGLALVFAIIHPWREAPAGSPRIWLLVPLLLFWSNLDPRAWLGLLATLLYLAGDGLGYWLNSPAALATASRRQLLKVNAASAAAMLIHPFGWKSLAAPWLLYTVEYPAIRDYIQETALGAPRLPAHANLIFFPMTLEDFWMNLNLASLASLSVVGAALVTLVLNRRRLDWGLVVALAGFMVLAVACVHELAAVAIVAAVVATLSGQAWYAASCRQTYSIAPRELLFSRGGRALTVLAIAAAGFFGGTGRLREGFPISTGYGLDPNLEMQLTDLERQLAGEASFDHRPFNWLMTLGDQLIWVGEQVFIDSRVVLYSAQNPDDDLLTQQLLLRDSLRTARDPGQRSAPGIERRGALGKLWDKFGVTHVVLRLLATHDYEVLGELLQDNSQWVLTNVGAATAVFYRTAPAVQDRELYATFAQAHKLDFRERAFQRAQPYFGGRERQIRPPSFYKQYFWSSRVTTPPEIHEARNLVQLGVYSGLPPELNGSRTAMIYLGIRLAQSGLAKDPDSVLGYLLLGEAYAYLAELEARASFGARPAQGGMRYVQAVGAFNQALVGDPENLKAHQMLAQLYGSAQKLDLGLRHMEALDQILAANPETPEADLMNLGNQIRGLSKRKQAIEDEVEQRLGTETNPLSKVQAYLQYGCVLKALREIDLAGPQFAGNLQVDQLKIALLLEAGRLEEAYELAGRFAAVAAQAGLSDWSDVVALSSLPQADYEGALNHWIADSDEIETRALTQVVVTLPPRSMTMANTFPWPIPTTSQATELFFRNPERIASLRLNAALVNLERGELDLAGRMFRDVLAANPDSTFRRLVAFYLSEMSNGKEEIDLVPPSDRVPELFEPETEAAPEN